MTIEALLIVVLVQGMPTAPQPHGVSTTAFHSVAACQSAARQINARQLSKQPPGGWLGAECVTVLPVSPPAEQTNNGG